MDHASTIVLGQVHTRKGSTKKKHLKYARILLDTGCAATLINKDYVKRLKTKTAKATNWVTKAGTFQTTRKAKIGFILPEFHENRDILWEMYVDEADRQNTSYDIIIGRDLLAELGINFLFDKRVMVWDNSSVLMKSHDYLSERKLDDFEKEIQFMHDPDTTDIERIQRILDVKYAPADLEAEVNKSEDMTKSQKEEMLQLLYKYEDLFDGKLGTWQTEPIELELKEGIKPYHAKPYPVPHSQEQKLRNEVDFLCQQGVMRKINNSEWAAPMFVIPKPDGTLRSLADFRELNKRIKRKPYPIPRIQDMLQKLKGFQWTTSLDLNMGYYHILLNPDARRYCTIVLPWGKYEYLRLPMGLCNSPDIFQERMSELMDGLNFARAYIDDLLIITQGDFKEHLNHLDSALTRLKDAGLKICAAKSKLGRHELEYLGYFITRDGIKPLNKKVEAINNLATPKNRRELRKFIGLVNYYRDMWPKRSEILGPLTGLTSTSVPWKWTPECQHAFEAMKSLVARDVILSYPQFDKPFHIHTDASKSQLGAVISQENKPIAFYSRKLSPAQTRYTTTERELLSIVEVLKEFRNILLGQQIIIHTDHENLTYKKFNSDRVMRWRLFVEEYSPDIRYIKGENNDAADALSRLEIANPPMEEAYFTEELRSFLYCNATRPMSETCPLNFQELGKGQSKDETLKKRLLTKQRHYHLKQFDAANKSWELICFKDKIVVAKPMQSKVVNWYHNFLGHPGINRTEETISQHLWWPNMREHITRIVSHCDSCQRNKRHNRKFGLLPPKEAESIPWDKLCVDLIGPYKIRRKGQPDLVCRCVTMIDPATGWFEICQYDDKRSITVANIVEQEWLCRYPWPTQITFDRGSEFIGHDFKDMVKNDYGIKTKPITTRNPQANAIVERVHQVIANIIRTFELQDNYLDEDDPWKGILAATAFAVRSTYHTTLQKTPGQLVFGRDMIFNLEHKANWEYIRLRKQQVINKNNSKENALRIPHTYRPGDQVMLRTGTENKYETPYSGPHNILRVNTNGTVRLRMGAVVDTINIRRLTPYKAPDTSHGGECNMPRTRSRSQRLNTSQ